MTSTGDSAETDTSNPDRASAKPSRPTAPPPRSMQAWIFAAIYGLPAIPRYTIMCAIALTMGWTSLPAETKRSFANLLFPAPTSASAPESDPQQNDEVSGRPRIDTLDTSQRDWIQLSRSAADSQLVGGDGARERSLALYREAVERIAIEPIGDRDRALLDEARRDHQDGFLDDALRKYDAVFAALAPPTSFNARRTP